MLHVISTFALGQWPLVPQFAEHYRSLGCDRLWLTPHIGARNGITASVRAATAEAQRQLAALGAEPLPPLVCEFDAWLLERNHDRIRRRRIHPDDWILWADIDEFQIFPDETKRLLARAAEQGLNAVSGEMVDRIAESGELISFEPAAPIWRQFPMACDITQRVLGGYSHKVAATRATIQVTPGHHEVRDRQNVGWAAELVAVHHFKWDATVLDRLRPRLSESWKARFAWWTETQRFYDHVAQHGRIDTTQLACLRLPDGRHRIDDHAAWAFVASLRAANMNWREGQARSPRSSGRWRRWNPLRLFRTRR